MANRQLVAGNWKMNATLAEGAALLGALRAGAAGLTCDLLVCPPATLLQVAAHALLGSGIAVGGQDCHAKPKGAHTGDISAPQLRDVGATHVILGHSERRAPSAEGGHAETDAQVHAKTLAAMAAGLIPIVCVGETLAERQAEHAQDVVRTQLSGRLPEGFAAGAGVVAYEPVWAIGTGLTPTVAEVEAMHGFIRARLAHAFGPAGAAVRVLYGGSVKPDNAAALLGVAEVDGALVGGASLKATDFLAIARAAKSAQDAIAQAAPVR
jgi:triosephosphate isomerase